MEEPYKHHSVEDHIISVSPSDLGSLLNQICPPFFFSVYFHAKYSTCILTAMSSVWQFLFSCISESQTSEGTIQNEHLFMTVLWIFFFQLVHQCQKMHEVWKLAFEKPVIVAIKLRLWPRTATTREHSHNSIIRLNATMIGEGQLTIGTTIWFTEAPINLSALWSTWGTQLETKQSQLLRRI